MKFHGSSLTSDTATPLLEKLIVGQLVKKSPAFYNPRVHCCIHNSLLLASILS
jgi:hypothetical protein